MSERPPEPDQEQHLVGAAVDGPDGGIMTSSTGARLPDGADGRRPRDPTEDAKRIGFVADNDGTGQSEHEPKDQEPEGSLTGTPTVADPTQAETRLGGGVTNLSRKK